MTGDTNDNDILRRIADIIERGISDGGPAGAGDGHPDMHAGATRQRHPGPDRHLAKLAHELKTPLSAIVAAAEIMRDERFGPVGNPRYQGYAADIFESAHHALGVINAMLGDTSGPGDADGQPAFAEIDLNGLVERMASSVRALLEAVGLTISHVLDPALPHVIADPGTVRQMLLNLVTNAMHATPPGGRVVISTGYDLAGPVHVTVTDTGCGMTPDDMARALDPARPAGFEATPSGGMGLGYPVVLDLAARNGATVGIESIVGAGTSVRISFAPGRTIPV